MGFIASTFSPMSILQDFVEKILLVLGSNVNESASFNNTTGAISRLNLAQYITITKRTGDSGSPC